MYKIVCRGETLCINLARKEPALAKLGENGLLHSEWDGKLGGIIVSHRRFDGNCNINSSVIRAIRVSRELSLINATPLYRLCYHWVLLYIIVH